MNWKAISLTFDAITKSTSVNFDWLSSKASDMLSSRKMKSLTYSTPPQTRWSIYGDCHQILNGLSQNFKTISFLEATGTLKVNWRESPLVFTNPQVFQFFSKRQKPSLGFKHDEIVADSYTFSRLTLFIATYSGLHSALTFFVSPYLKSRSPMQHKLVRSAVAAMTQNGCKATIRPHLKMKEKRHH